MLLICIGANVNYWNIDINANTMDLGVDGIRAQIYNFHEEGRACNDGTLSIDSNYCYVMYYAEFERGQGLYYIQFVTQVRDGLSAIWIFGDYSPDGLVQKAPLISEIINSMRPVYSSVGGSNYGGYQDSYNDYPSDYTIEGTHRF